ncbi:MAG: hypothetical protein U0Q11_04695 [Vicinamibacterales bacterium]
MTRRFALALALSVTLGLSLSAQFVVYDPVNYANALLRYYELQQQLFELISTYEQIRTQYLLLKQQAQKLPFSLAARYRTLATPWVPLIGASTYGRTAPWILSATTGVNAVTAFTQATQALQPYGAGLTGLSAAETARIQTRYDRTQLRDGTLATALTAIGRLRQAETTVETTLKNLESDAYTDVSDYHTQIAVLNKINATGVTAARMAKDTNALLVSLLEGQMLDATERREASAQAIAAQAAFLTEARPLLARTTAQTTTALTTFRIP